MDRSSGRALTSPVAVPLAALVAVSAGVEATRPYAGSQAWLVPLVGVVLAGSAAMVRAPALPRLLLAVASGAWLLGSLSPWLLLAHQGALVLVLLAVPTGRIEGMARWVGVLSVPIALGMLAQPVVGVILSLVGAGALRRGRTPDRLGAAAAGLLVGGALLGAWSVSRSGGSFDPDVAVLVYEAAVVAAAAALVLGSRAAWNRQRDLMDRLVLRSGQTGVLGLAEVLAEMLRAPGLEIGGTRAGAASRRPGLVGRRHARGRPGRGAAGCSERPAPCGA